MPLKPEAPAFRHGVIHPDPYGGCWPGRKSWARIRNRKFRRAATVAVAQEKDIPIAKKTVAYDIW
jgi:hypothetical protein